MRVVHILILVLILIRFDFSFLVPCSLCWPLSPMETAAAAVLQSVFNYRCPGERPRGGQWALGGGWCKWPKPKQKQPRRPHDCIQCRSTVQHDSRQKLYAPRALQRSTSQERHRRLTKGRFVSCSVMPFRFRLDYSIIINIIHFHELIDVHYYLISFILLLI